MIGILYFRTPSPWNIHDNNQVPEKREDGWMEVIVWKFNSTSELRKDYIPMHLKLIAYEGTMSGLIVGGLEIRPMLAFISVFFKMANKHSIMTREMVESFCDSYYIPDEVHPAAPGRDRTITQFPEGKVGVYTRLFDYCGYRIPLTKFFVSVLKYFRIHISQLSPFGAARISHFEVLTRVLDLGPSVAVFRAFYTRIYSDGLFSFAKRSLSAPSCLSKPPDSIKNWADHFFWVDSRVFPISVPLYTGGVLEKDPAPHLTARQEQAVQVLSSNKAPFRRYPECFLALVGLSPYYPFGENTYPAFERPDRTENTSQGNSDSGHIGVNLNDEAADSEDVEAQEVPAPMGRDRAKKKGSSSGARSKTSIAGDPSLVDALLSKFTMVATPFFTQRKESSSKYLRIKERELELEERKRQEQGELERMRIAQREKELDPQQKMFKFLQQQQKIRDRIASS
ncbi:hypothetical protein Tco_0226178 [Tanacetum coccineum]